MQLYIVTWKFESSEDQLYSSEAFVDYVESGKSNNHIDIDFNLADYSSNTILSPKIQEMPSTLLLSCLFKNLINETTSNALSLSPRNSQTGPAKRNDRETINKHLELLENNSFKKVYKTLTESIIKYYEN